MKKALKRWFSAFFWGKKSRRAEKMPIFVFLNKTMQYNKRIWKR